MIRFKKNDGLIILKYQTDNDINWLREKFENDESYSCKITYTLNSLNIYQNNRTEEIEQAEENIFFVLIREMDFVFARLEHGYYKVERGILVDKFDIYFYKDFEFDNKLFIAERDVSIFRKIEKLVKENIYIGGPNSAAISEIDFRGIIDDFPNQYEKKIYSEARLSNVIKEFFSSTVNAKRKFENYIEKKRQPKGKIWLNFSVILNCLNIRLF